MTSRREGLLDLNSIRQVLSEEDTVDRYKIRRSIFTGNEPLLARNLAFWVDRELEQLGMRFPDLNDEHLHWIGHLIERYFLRGVYMQKKAFCLDLEESFRISCEEPHGFDPHPEYVHHDAPPPPPGFEEESELDEGFDEEPWDGFDEEEEF